MKNTEKNYNLIQSPLEEVLPNSMMPYAEFVIMDRALPRVEDGLKPVQRRILYTMYELGITSDKPHKKCARIVGDCMGKYHPHGDSSVYDAMVRMAQSFNMRMTLVNGHGNFGSVDGDRAAAMRYTEARLETLAIELLKDIDKDTVKFNLNFDDSLKEPDTLPGRYPNLLVNGSSGIAVGLATNIPPHNLGEVINGVVEYIDNPKISLKKMMKFIKGPDFPTGGFISPNELEQAYGTGKGRIVMRAKINIENAENGKKNIVITELPYQINKANLLKKIADLREAKKDILFGIADIVDESDRNGMRAVIKLKKDIDPDSIMCVLLKNTDLECTFGINMVAIAEGKPKQMGLIEIIGYYVEYQREIVLRRTKYDLNEAKARCHILEGLIIAVRNIDEVIKIIKAAKDVPSARKTLRQRFDLSEKQAQAILDLRLSRLTKLEIFKLEKELKELQELIKKLEDICASKKLQMDIVKEELVAIKKKYADPRRSIIISADEPVVVEVDEIEKPSFPVYFIVSGDGNIKKVPEKNYNMSQKKICDNTSKKELVAFKMFTYTDKEVLIFTDKGNAVKISMESINMCKLKEKSIKLKDICPDCLSNEKIVAVFECEIIEKQGSFLFITKNGNIKKSEFKDYNLNKSVFQAIKLKDEDSLMYVFEDKADTSILFITKMGMCLNASKNDIPTQGRIAGGVRGIQLNSGDKTLFCEQIETEGEIIVITANGNAKKVIAANIDVMARYRKGLKLCETSFTNGVIYAGYVKHPYELICEDKDENLYCISTEDIPIEKRTGKGKPIKKLKDKVLKSVIKNNW